MQNLSPDLKVLQNYLSAIRASIGHFTAIENEICRFISDNPEQKLAPNYQKASNCEPLCVDKFNYMAIVALEKLGIASPSQAQIDKFEAFINETYAIPETSEQANGVSILRLIPNPKSN